MRFIDYLYDRRFLILFYVLSTVLYIVTFWLYDAPMDVVIYPGVIVTVLGIVALVADYIRCRRKFEKLKSINESPRPDIEELNENLNTIETEFAEIIKTMEKREADLVFETGRKSRDMADYYTAWAHQIKIPIASMKLILKEEDSEAARKVNCELQRIERYAEMVLAYIRLGSPETDYVFEETELDPLVRSAVKKFSTEFITGHIALKMESLESKITTDRKWFVFVLEQLISNALKYTNEGSIEIFEKEGRLHIKDTGIGIEKSDLPRIFDKGFTGFNGRETRHSSGLGLYLCKRVMSNLGSDITVESEVGKGSDFSIGIITERPRFE